MFKLEGKTALVTGASGGIGAAIARALHTQGATVVLTGRKKEALDSLAGELKERCHVVVGSLDSAEGATAVVKGAEEVAGKIDILVNNAGMTKDNLSMRLSDEDWQQVLDINLTGTFRLARAVMRGMMKNRWGRIINITSIVGTTGNPGQANYAASKAGMTAMSKSMAAEVASRGITINCVAPGFIATAMTEALSDEQKSRLAQNIPSGNLGTPEDVAACVAFLASNDAGYVTGQTIHVNGGMAMI